MQRNQEKKTKLVAVLIVATKSTIHDKHRKHVAGPMGTGKSHLRRRYKNRHKAGLHWFRFLQDASMQELPKTVYMFVQKHREKALENYFFRHSLQKVRRLTSGPFRLEYSRKIPQALRYMNR